MTYRVEKRGRNRYDDEYVVVRDELTLTTREYSRSNDKAVAEKIAAFLNGTTGYVRTVE